MYKNTMRKGYSEVPEILELREFKAVGIEIAFDTDETRRKIADFEIRRKDELLSPKFGPNADVLVCATCTKDWKGCSSHFGLIEFNRPFMNPLAVGSIIYILNVFCYSCSKLVVTREELEEHGILKYKGFNRLKAINTYVKEYKKECKSEEKIQCPPIPNYSSKKKETSKLMYKLKGGEGYRTPTEIFKILDTISEKDAITLGFDVKHGSHPRNMMMSNMIVIPAQNRPSIRQGGTLIDHPLTTLYRDIISKLNVVNRSFDDSLITAVDNLYDTIKAITKGESAQGGNVRYYQVKRNLRDMIQGKEGMIRGNTQAKRTDQSGRTVLEPGNYLKIDELGIPEEMCKNLTQKILAIRFTIDDLQTEYNEGRVNYVTKRGKDYDTRYTTLGPDYKIQLGDYVHRHFRDGDFAILNRPPSLHKQNFSGLKVKVVKGDKTLKINMAVTGPQHADFDGDEAHVHSLQTSEANIEVMILMAIQNNLMDDRNNRVMIGNTYDALTGAYLMSKETDEVNEKIYTYIFEPLIKDEVPQLQSLGDRLENFGISRYSPRGIISASFPEDFFYSAKGVVIKNGVLLSGVLSKKTLGTVDGGIITIMRRQFTNKIVGEFMSNIQFIVNRWLEHRGFTVTLEDCVSQDTKKTEMINLQYDETAKEVIRLSSEKKGFESEYAKLAIKRETEHKLKSLTQLVEKMGKESFSNEKNNYNIMMESGSKGKVFNIIQMNAMIGQQYVGGVIPDAILPGERVLPCFKYHDKSPNARGYCRNSFGTGLDPDELFFHAMSTREGLTDTSQTTAETGALHHKVGKTLEDITIATNGNVIGPNNIVVQTLYGGDGFTAGELQQIGDDRLPVNFAHLAKELNHKFLYIIA